MNERRDNAAVANNPVSESRIICTICARGGSKNLKNKNLLSIGGVPLIAHSIAQAKQARLFAAIAVSSDSGEIREVARQHGADFLIARPDELSTDEAPKIPAILHCVKSVESLVSSRFEIVVDLDATAPLRTPGDIRACVDLLVEKNGDNVITGVPAKKSPYFNMVELSDEGLAHLSKPPSKPFARRQDVSPVYDMNASIYVWRREILESEHALWTERTLLYVMPEESIDIDSDLDFALVKMVMDKRCGSVSG